MPRSRRKQLNWLGNFKQAEKSPLIQKFLILYAD